MGSFSINITHKSGRLSWHRPVLVLALAAGLLLASLVAEARALIDQAQAVRLWSLIALALATWHLHRSLWRTGGSDQHLSMALCLALSAPAGLWLHPAWVVGGIAMHYLWAMWRMNQRCYPATDGQQWLIALPPALLSFFLSLVLIHLVG